MRRDRPRLLVWLAWLLLVVGLPLAGKWARQDGGPRCAFDGLPIEPLYRVRVVDRAGRSHSFCCVGCAERWLVRQTDGPAAVHVTDEAGGGEVDAASATFVRSSVTTSPVTRNRVHVFRDPAAALEHAESFDGWLLTGPDRPFHEVVEP